MADQKGEVEQGKKSIMGMRKFPLCSDKQAAMIGIKEQLKSTLRIMS